MTGRQLKKWREGQGLTLVQLGAMAARTPPAQRLLAVLFPQELHDGLLEPSVRDGGEVVAAGGRRRSSRRWLPAFSTERLCGIPIPVSKHAVSRLLRNGLTLDSLKAGIAEATTSSAAALAAQSGAPMTALAGTSVLVLQDRRQFSRRTAIGEGYSIPHVADLNPAEEIRREYVLPGEFRGIKSEVVIVGEDGTETVVESTEHQVFEVIAVTP